MTAEDQPELHWRLARREAYDSLSALVQSIERSLSEPRAVRPPQPPLERLLAHSYQLMAQLTAVKTTLLMRRGHLDRERLAGRLQAAADSLESIFRRARPTLQRRLGLATELAAQLVDAANEAEKKYRQYRPANKL